MCEESRLRESTPPWKFELHRPEGLKQVLERNHTSKLEVGAVEQQMHHSEEL